MIEVLCGDALTVLKTLPDNSVQCCTTSPPYYGLRQYLSTDHPNYCYEIGSESTPAAYVENLVEVFREVRRVLREDGVVFLNLGDSYGHGTRAGRQQSANPGVGANRPEAQNSIGRNGLAAKQLIGIPWRVAFALQDDGWYLRQDIIWSKKNCMPESVTDRCTKSHEYVFLLAKSAHYFYAAEAVKEPAKDWGTRDRKSGSAFVDGVPGRSHQSGGQNCNFAESGRNRRSVWVISPAAYREAHFATMPPELAEICVLAGSRSGDTILDPFGGSGTTGEVAQRLGRKAILIELNPDYLPLIHQRTRQTSLGLSL